ncbi:hypothetical protein [Brevibacterium oceani]|uniref:hypothetical protein n=1 Tax=Brevibacterium oceani TaxID=358099 RepID=UPI0015E7DD42|nr:hypothetical protein [Brevibacterium oceani]
MIPKLEGPIRPGAGISFDAQNTMNGGYAEAPDEAKRNASLHAVAEARDLDERRTFLAMLGLLPPRPQEGTPCGSGR